VVHYEALIDEKWRAIVRYDSRHGFAHRDVIRPSGDQDKYPPFEDLGVAMTYGEQDIEDRWEWYRKRYEDRRGDKVETPVGAYAPYSRLMNKETRESSGEPPPSPVSLGVLAV